MAEFDLTIARFLSDACLFLVPLCLILILVALVQMGKKRKSWKITLSWLGVLMISGVLIGASLQSFNSLSWLSQEHYIITISIDGGGNASEPIELLLPLPDDYHGEFNDFSVLDITTKEFIPVEHRPDDFNYSVVNTTLGRMLSVITSQSLILFTRSNGGAEGRVYVYDAEFAKQRNDSVPLYLEPTQHSVSVAVYFELYFSVSFFTWDSRYTTIAESEPEFEELYHDFNLGNLSVDRFEVVPAPLVNGWQNITVISGSFDHAT